VPGFRVHITGSTIIGAGYGTAAWALGDMPPITCVLAGGLCSVAGMLPDLDSGPGIPLKESVAFAAAVVPMMMIHRFHQMQLPLEAMILAGAAIYLVIRFGLSWLLKNYSHHRGMFHSLPAAAIAGQTTLFYGPVVWPNLVTYVLALILGALAAGDAALTEGRAAMRQRMEQASRNIQQIPYQWQYRR